ncbi:hypothetical protein N4R57_13840 [Rhodobacteraceae bacterium D3-12]|nr:hypothetical protein N4R57_13840 [Rhodobacteraceae bacterium D3-12]
MNAPPPPYRFENRGRSRRAMITLALIWSALAALTALIDLSLWIGGAVLLLSLPAAWEVLRDPRSSLTLDTDTLAWTSARFSDSLPLRQIRSVRFDTRLDLSVKMTLLLTDGRKIRLPHACAPPHRSFEAALKTRGIATERHHFTLIG